MKIIKRLSYIFIFTICMLFGCSEADPLTGVTKSPHFITEYVMPTGVKITTNSVGDLFLCADGEIYKTWGNKDSEEYKKAKYFCDLYNDNSYRGSVYPGLNAALAYPIENLTIYCATDFDANHPAGEPLDDIVELDFQTYYDYVKSGYTSYKDNPDWMSQTVEHFILSFDKVSADVTKLVSIGLSASGYFSGFNFTSTPAEPGEYTFTLEMTTNGETFTTEFTHTFE